MNYSPKMPVLFYNQWLSLIKEKEDLQSFSLLLWEALQSKENLSDDESFFLLYLRESKISLYEWDSWILSEGFIEKLTDWSKSMAKSAPVKGIKKWAGQQIEGIPEFFKALGSSIKNFAKLVFDLFSSIYKSVFGTPRDYAKRALGATYSEVERKTKEAVSKEPEPFKKEIPGFVSLVAATPKVLSPKIIGEKLISSLQKSDSQKIEYSDLSVASESLSLQIFLEAIQVHTMEEIREGVKLLNEQEHIHAHTEIPFVSTMSELLEKVPPFSWLGELAEYFGEKSNQFLNFVSETYYKMGVIKEEVEFALLGSLVGIGLETLAKGSVKSVLLHFFPVLKTALILMGAIATGIAIVHVASTVIDGLKDQTEELDKEAKAASR